VQHRRLALRPSDRGDGSCELELDGSYLKSTDTVTQAVAEMLGLLNSIVFVDNPHLVLHAGAVVRDGVGIVLPGNSGSGKSTLTAGLVRAGFGYLSDEGVGFEPGSSLMLPYPRPITLEERSWALFPELEPAPLVVGEPVTQWFVPASTIREDSIAPPAAFRLVVLPRFEPSGPTRLEPIGRAEAVTGLVRNTMQFSERTRLVVDHFAGAVRGADCYRLAMGSLDRAVEILDELAHENR
jgi:hypothetical protein